MALLPFPQGTSEQRNGQERTTGPLWAPAFLALLYSFPRDPEQGEPLPDQPWALGFGVPSAFLSWFLPYFGIETDHHPLLDLLFVVEGNGIEQGQPRFTLNFLDEMRCTLF